MGFEALGIHEITYNSIIKCPVDVRRDMFSNILLSGGSSMFPGLPERLEREMLGLAEPAMRIKINAPEDRQNSAWIGGSIIASDPTFSYSCITKDDSLSSFRARRALDSRARRRQLRITYRRNMVPSTNTAMQAITM